MPDLNCYLHFNDNCEEAFNLYRSVFGGDFEMLARFGEAPSGEMKLNPGEENKVLHVALKVGQNSMLMGSDCPEAYGMTINQGNNYSVSINADSREQADTFYAKLSEGGQAMMPMADAFWGDYFGMAMDKFGVNWMISYSGQKHA